MALRQLTYITTTLYLLTFSLFPSLPLLPPLPSLYRPSRSSLPSPCPFYFIIICIFVSYILFISLQSLLGRSADVISLALALLRSGTECDFFPLFVRSPLSPLLPSSRCTFFFSSRSHPSPFLLLFLLFFLLFFYIFFFLLSLAVSSPFLPLCTTFFLLYFPLSLYASLYFFSLSSPFLPLCTSFFSLSACTTFPSLFLLPSFASSTSFLPLPPTQPPT